VLHQQRYDAMIGAFAEPLLSAASIEAADRVLDLGCGNGRPPGGRAAGSPSVSTCPR
jgi:hypothetical protein